MKKILSFSIIVLFLLSISSCFKEAEDKFDEGAVPVITAVTPNYFDFAAINDAAISITVDSKGLDVSEVKVYVSHNGGQSSLLTTITSFPGTVNVTASEAATVAGITIDDIALKDVFTFLCDDVKVADGRVFKSAEKVDVPVSCPSDLAGTYSVVTTYHQHDFLPDFAEYTTTIDVVQVDDGIYEVTDFSGGLYSEGPYVDAYGTSALTNQFKEICGEIILEGQMDPWQDLINDPDRPSYVDQVTGEIHISVLGTVYGENWTSVYTPQ